MNADTIRNFTNKLKGKKAYDKDYELALEALISVSCEVIKNGKR
jgi:hypothetical protein